MTEMFSIYTNQNLKHYKTNNLDYLRHVKSLPARFKTKSDELLMIHFNWNSRLVRYYIQYNLDILILNLSNRFYTTLKNTCSLRKIQFEATIFDYQQTNLFKLIEAVKFLEFSKRALIWKYCCWKYFIILILEWKSVNGVMDLYNVGYWITTIWKICKALCIIKATKLIMKW